MNAVVNLIVLFIISLFMGVFIYSTNEVKVTENTNSSFACGTVSRGDHSESGRKGKTLFRNYCASCHSKDMKKNMTGPGLGNTIRQWDSISMQRFLIDPQLFMTPKNKKLHSSLTGESRHTAFPGLTRSEVQDLIEYIK